jgi:heptosyltransferase-1
MILKSPSNNFLNKGKIMRILIVKMSSLGDIIHAFPVVEFLKQCEPQCEIDWAVEQPFAELVQAHPLIHRVLRVQTKKWRSQLSKKNTWREIHQFRKELRQTRYDLVLDLQGNMKSAFVTASARSPLKVGFNYTSVSEWPNLLVTHKKYQPPSGGNVREEYLFLAQCAMDRVNQTPTSSGVKLNLTEQDRSQLQTIITKLKQRQGLKVLICSGSNWPNKQLSKECLQSFMQSFVKEMNAHFLFAWGNASEKKVAEELTIALPENSSIIDRLSLPALQNLMDQVDLVLAMDSLPLHLAGTTATPTYSVFGASSAQKYKPVGERHEAFQGQCPYGKTFERRCNVLRTCRTGACIKHLQGEQLFKHFHAWWSTLKGCS